MGEYDGPCEAGCMSFHGGEKKHHRDCGHYPASLTKLWHDTEAEYGRELVALRKERDALSARVEAMREELTEARRIIGIFQKSCVYTDEQTFYVAFGRFHEAMRAAEKVSKGRDAMAADMGAMREELVKVRQALHDINDALSGPANFSEAFERAGKARDIAREALADTAKLLAAEAAMKGEKG